MCKFDDSLVNSGRTWHNLGPMYLRLNSVRNEIISKVFWTGKEYVWLIVAAEIWWEQENRSQLILCPNHEKSNLM